MDLVPPSIRQRIPQKVSGVTQDMPDWSLEHWTPISVNSETITLCQLNFEEYYNMPHVYPMFKDLVAASKCDRKSITRSLKDIIAEIKASQDSPSSRVVAPTGFIFHESRVGSTLVANLLASNPWGMVRNTLPIRLYLVMSF